jgi:hypothetical protein
MTKLTLMLVSLTLVAGSMISCATSRQISSGNSNMCMNVEWHGYPVAGTPIRVKPCDPWRNQQWMLNKGQITGVGGFCLDVQGSVASEGAPVLYVPYTGGGGAAPANWTPLGHRLVYRVSRAAVGHSLGVSDG